MCSIALWCLTLCNPMDWTLGATLSMEFLRLELELERVPFSSADSGESLDPGIEPTFPALAGRPFTTVPLDSHTQGT